MRVSENVHRWRQNASQEQSALTRKEKIAIFLSTLSLTYDKLIGHASVSFTNLVQLGERKARRTHEDGLKKLVNQGPSDAI